MSDQSDALQKKALEAGIVEQTPPPQPPALEDDPERPELPWVALPVDGRIVNDFNTEIGAIVAGLGLYRYKDRIVTVSVNERTNRIEIETMTAHCFRDWVENHLLCYRNQFSKHGATRVKATMGVEHAETCLQSHAFRARQDRLVRVNAVRLPIARVDGGIEILPEGYDRPSGILTLGPRWDYDEAMTPEQACHVLDDLDREFPFQDERSKAVMRCAMLSQFCYLLQAAHAKRVNFLFHANSSRSGKTLLVEIVLTLAWGYATVEGMPDDTGKLRDRLDTAVRNASPFVCFDDLDQTYLRSGMLNAFMSASWWSGRKFHSQDEFNEPKTPVVFLTANNLEVTPDIAGRTLTCDLFTAEANAQDRQIEKEFDAEWIRTPAIHRQICSALWALVKQWRDGGRMHEGRIVKGYGEWSRIFGGMTMSAGYGDPCAARDSDSYGNTEYADMLALITALSEGVLKTEEYEFGDIINYCRTLNCFPHLIKGRLVKSKGEEGEKETTEFVPTDETNSAVGRLLGRYGGKSFMIKGGRRVIFDKRGKNRHRRYVIQVSAVGAA